MEDEINKGMPSDRFEAEWWVASSRVELAMEKKLSGSKKLSELKAETITRTIRLFRYYSSFRYCGNLKISLELVFNVVSHQGLCAR